MKKENKITKKDIGIFVAGMILTYIFLIFSSDIMLDSTATIDSNNMTIEVINPTIRSSGNVKVYGIGNEKDILIGESDTTPAFSKKNISIKLNVDFVPLNNNNSIISIPIGKWLNSKTLLYSIDCEICRSQTKWERVSKFTSIDPIMIIRNVNGKYVIDASEPFYSWIEIKPE